MKITKAQREQIRLKYGGRCAYCGCELPDRWHVDHIDPIVRNDWLKVPLPPNYPERDSIENMNPACQPCNIDKHSMSIEEWRKIISRSNEVLMRDVSTFRRAIRFKLLDVVNVPVTFHFERCASQEPQG